MAKKLSLTIIIANLISLVLMTGLITVLDTNSLITHLFILPVFAILVFFSLVTRQVGQALANLFYSSGLLVYLIILVQYYNNAYITGLFISGGYAFIATILFIVTSTQKREKAPLARPPAPIQVYEETFQTKPVTKKASTKKKVAKKTTKPKKKKVTKKASKKVTTKKAPAKKTTKKVATKNDSTKTKTKTIQTDDGKQIVINIQN